MHSDSSAKARFLASNDSVLHPGWLLLDFLMSLNADEFALRFVYIGDDGKGKAESDRLFHGLDEFWLGEKVRECITTYAGEVNPRSVPIWRLNGGSLQSIRRLMPTGILSEDRSAAAWAEDLCVYRKGELMFGAISHERSAFLRLSDSEWQQWQASPPAFRKRGRS